MPATSRGIYHNLKESKYVVSNSEITFFFSSQVYQNKFINGYKQHRETVEQKVTCVMDGPAFNVSFLADLSYYKQVEKRGFYAQWDGVEMTWQSLRPYALRKMTEKNSLNWRKTQRAKLTEVLRNMEQSQNKL